MFYLGKYIMSKELYDKQQQHIVHCENNALGAIFGVTSFSVKEPRALFAMISKNVTAVKIPESQSSFRECSTLGEADRGPEETNPRSSTSTPQQRKRQWSSDPASVSVEEVSGEPQKRQKSDNSSPTFGDSLSCVLGDLCRERGSSESSVAHSILDITRSHSGRSDEGEDLESDNFSVDFEVESLESDTYSEKDEDSIPGEDEVLTILYFKRTVNKMCMCVCTLPQDYWKCAECEELNPPLPHHCKCCWKVCPGGLLEISSVSENPSHDTPEAKALCAECPTPGSLDVLDGKSSRSQSASCSSCQGLCLCYSQPSTSSIQEETPELERSPKSSLPASCLEPCIICQSRPKDGTFIHGSTGHLVACYICAKKLEKCNKPCPVCQEPIQSVILTYLN
ncbi:hypothetical protein QTP86_016004 [Hemibagrus guttatus]|nr:hypothetical protein QTP86_016004 [Hemibagrus guttatus]